MAPNGINFINLNTARFGS